MLLIKPTQFKANLHSHSTLSDGALTPAQLKEAYRSHGYSVLAITDHERPCDHSALSEDDFLMLTGYEAYIRPSDDCKYDPYAPEIHLNFFAEDPHNVDLINWNDKYVKYVKNPVEKKRMPRFGSDKPRKYTPEYISAMIENARKDGYFVSLNHPVWSLENNEFLFGLSGCGSMEICNYSSFVNGLHEYNIALYDMMLRRGKRIFCHSADDNHNHASFDAPECDSFGGFTMFNTADDRLSYDGIFRSLKNGCFYSSMGPLIRSLEISGGNAILKSSDAVRISMFNGAKTAKSIYAKRGETICEAVFELPQKGEFVRFSVTDDRGRYADTRGYFRNEWEKH